MSGCYKIENCKENILDSFEDYILVEVTQGFHKQPIPTVAN